MAKPLLTLALAALASAAQAAPVDQPDWQLERIELAYPSSIEEEAEWVAAEVDPYILPAQTTTPTSPSTSRFTRSQTGRSRFSTTGFRRGAAQTGAYAALASVPFMIGDTGAGTCLSFATIGYYEADISHPTLTCSRLNIAENNRAITSDRVYFSYRHFHNASPGRVFQFSQNLNIDRYTLGLEKTFGDGWCSIELRVPLEDRITSNMATRVNDVNPPDTFFDDDFQVLGGRELELANISAIFKMVLAEHEGFVLSAGCGMTAPTAQDVRHNVDIQNIVFTYLDLPDPFATLSYFDLDTHFTNETWYLSPFLAWSNRSRNSPFFYQGFLQVEVPTNPMRVRYTDNGSFSIVSYDFVNPEFGVIWTVDGLIGGSVIRDVHAQPLMRLNLGGGCFLIDESDNHSLFEQLIAMAEIHYTTPLQDAKLARIPLDVLGVDTTGEFTGAFDAFDPFIGNRNSRVDILNGVLGVSARINGTQITNGFTMPLRTGDNRAFDFEYNLQVQRPF
ncbi:hypothetical protein KOR34_10000 [Posidoniimonas corsicana]|uniref:Bacterial surface antigen (D15) domain-containing protein n=1 Tax=Posidoniimonas corsicana TaxID=1938618 RepID=A0A5C5VD07_9BACT|nr:hypothetical protein [Posidoniimonas corsicana]TWT36101.1 hypothetical protein KOR34_10000 [Posidoniimonas corsicana]